MTFKWLGKSADGKTITLRQLELAHFKFPAYFTPEWEALHATEIRVGAVIDIESTGLSNEKDQIIEIGVRQFKFNRVTGELLSLEKHYSGFQDPGEPLSEEIKALTGITDEQLKGQSIDWSAVNALFSTSHLLIAHNAAFDRPFVDQQSTVSSEKIWACSLRQIDWTAKGFPTQKLEMLSVFHGFFNDAHRALADADSLLYLLTFSDASTNTPYLLELVNNARKPVVHMIATAAPFESKDFLKNRNYRWDGQNRVWTKQIAKEEVASEKDWLEKTVYLGSFRGKTVEIQPVDQFKAQ